MKEYLTATLGQSAYVVVGDVVGGVRGVIAPAYVVSGGVIITYVLANGLNFALRGQHVAQLFKKELVGTYVEEHTHGVLLVVQVVDQNVQIGNLAKNAELGKKRRG